MFRESFALGLTLAEVGKTRRTDGQAEKKTERQDRYVNTGRRLSGEEYRELLALECTVQFVFTVYEEYRRHSRQRIRKVNLLISSPGHRHAWMCTKNETGGVDAWKNTSARINDSPIQWRGGSF